MKALEQTPVQQAPDTQAKSALRRSGRPTTNAEAALRGVILAIGGYKGIGLSVMANVLAGVLAGSAHTGPVNVGKRGQCFLAVSPSLFGDAGAFLDEIESMVLQIKSAELLPGVDEVFLPGEIEERQYDERLARGAIAYPRLVIDALAALGGQIGIGFEPAGAAADRAGREAEP